MIEQIKDKVGRLLDERRGKPATAASDLAEARLVATFAEGLRDSTPPLSASSDDHSQMAAFIDGRLTEAELKGFTATLARDPGLRVELESTVALVDSVTGTTQAVPKDLLARAAAQFAPGLPSQRVAAPTRLRLAFARPRRWQIWTLAAVLAVAVIAPTALLIGDRGTGSGTGDERPTASPPTNNADSSAPQKPGCEDTRTEQPTAAPSAEVKDRPSKPTAAPSPKDNDPCQPPLDDRRRPAN